MNLPRRAVSAADYDGDCVLTWRTPDSALGDSFEQKLFVDRADPRTQIIAELVREAELGTVVDVHGRPLLELDGDLFKIRGANRTVVYRLVAHILDRDVYLAEWPD